MPAIRPHQGIDTSARLTLVAVSLAWGLTWPAMRIALDEIPPFSMRVGTTGLAALALFAFALLRRRDLRIRGMTARAHLVVAGSLNVTAFAILTAFAQLATSTSRVSVLTYTMPIWAALFAHPILGERLNQSRAIALVLCAAGLAILVYPLLGSHDLVGIALALATGIFWGAGTVYLKWSRVEGDPLAISAWQVVVALVFSTVGVVAVEGSLHLWPAHWPALLALAFASLIGSAFAYLLWFDVVRRLPAMTASLGVLSVPVVGVCGSMLVLGERPTVPDMVGFALILTAAACVLLAPASRSLESR